MDYRERITSEPGKRGGKPLKRVGFRTARKGRETHLAMVQWGTVLLLLLIPALVAELTERVIGALTFVMTAQVAQRPPF